MPEAGSRSQPLRIERPYRVRFEEATADDTPRTAVYLAYVQDCAWQHSALLGFDRDWYNERGLFWLVRALRLDVLRPTAAYGDLSVSTRVVGFRRVMARRESEIRDRTGELVACAEIDWVMTNERGLPARIPFDFAELFGAEGGSFDVAHVTLPQPRLDATERPFAPARRDLDPLGHVNNSVYLDYLEEAIEAAGQSELLRHTPRHYALEYLSAAGRGTALVGRLWPDGEGWAYRLSREDGPEVLRARFSA